jgi:hypothetical protein
LCTEVELPQNIILYFIREWKWAIYMCTTFHVSMYNVGTRLLIIKQMKLTCNIHLPCKVTMHL